MFVIKRNQIIITALVVMIAVAGYLNYTDSRIKTPSGFAYSEEGDISALVGDINTNDSLVEVSKTTNEAIKPEGLTNADVISDNIEIATSDDVQYTRTDDDNNDSDNDSDSVSEPGEAMFVNASDDSTYFVQAKLDREQSRAKQRELLLELINNKNIEQTKKAECADAMLEIQKRIEKESAAEAMIESKGFSEVFVRIDDNTVDVVVNKEALSDAEIAQIEDIIKRKTGIDAENIRISPMKK